MKAVQINEFGGPDVMKVQDAPVPVPAVGQVLVRIAASAVNPADWKVREGYMKDMMAWTFPVTLGTEFSGVVEALGEGVTGFAPGDEVYGFSVVRGAFAEYAAVDAATLAKKPAWLDMVQAAALPVGVLTSGPVFEAGNVGKGSKLLVHAAAGGVGHILVQLAKAKGAEVTALGSPGNLAYLKSIGADHVVDRTTDYAATLGGFDVVVDGFGPATHAKSWGLLVPNGILVALTAPPSQEDAAAHGVRAVMTFGSFNAADLAEAADMVKAGTLKIEVQSVYPADRATEAMAEVEGGQVRGKVVITF